MVLYIYKKKRLQPSKAEGQTLDFRNYKIWLYLHVCAEQGTRTLASSWQTMVLPSRPLVYMSIPVLIWRWVADKMHACSADLSPWRWKLKNRGIHSWASVLLPLPFRLTIPGPADVWFTLLQLDWGNWTARYLVSGHHLNRCLCLIYEASGVQLHGWSFFHAGWACLWMPMSDEPGVFVCECVCVGGGGEAVLKLNSRHKERACQYILFRSHYLIIRSLLIRVKPNDEIFNFPLLPPYLFLKWD